MRTMLIFLAGVLVGVMLFWAAVMVTGGWHSYRILTNSGANFEAWIQRDRCEPFEVNGIIFGRCPRFLWP